MSINSMVNAALARRPDTIPLQQVPNTFNEIATAAMTPPSIAFSLPEPTTETKAAAGTVDTTFNVLFGYIPTEVLTLYVAVLAAVQNGGKVTRSEWSAFWVFLVATPIIVWLVFAAKLKALDKPLPLRVSAWPAWEMAAATIAYAAWAFALPHSPFTQYEWYSSPLSGLAVLITGAVLGLLAPFFQRPLAT